jgi:hypothetical protein
VGDEATAARMNLLYYHLGEDWNAVGGDFFARGSFTENRGRTLYIRLARLIEVRPREHSQPRPLGRHGPRPVGRRFRAHAV